MEIKIFIKKIIMFIVLSVFILATSFNLADAAVRVRGHFRKNGAYVQPYYRSSPNSYRFDNYSTRGNYNPFTGKKGYVSQYRW